MRITVAGTGYVGLSMAEMEVTVSLIRQSMAENAKGGLEPKGIPEAP